MSLYSCFNRLFHRNQGYQPVGIEETDELVGVQIDSAHLNKTTTQEIAKTILADYPSDPPAPPGTYTAWDFFKRQVIVLTQFTERAIVDALAMMIHSAEPEGGKGSIIPDKKTIEDLALVAGNGKPSVAYAMDRTKTLAGRLFLALRLTRPTDNLVTLKNRQALIQALIQDAECATHLSSHLENIGNHLTHLLSYWTKQRQLLPGRVDKYFLRLHPALDTLINGSRHGLTVNASLEVLKTALTTLTVATAAIAMPLYVASLTGVLGEGNASSFLGQYNARFSAASGPLYLLASLIPSSMTKAIGSLIGGVMACLTVKTAWEWNQVDLKFDRLTHEKIQSVSKAYRSIKQIYALLKGTPLARQLEEFPKLDAFFKNRKLKELFAALDSRTFDGPASSPVFQRGNVLFPWRQLEDKEVLKAFGEAVHAIGEIDAVLSSATLFKEGGYCFPEFVGNADRPFLSLSNYWHPMVGPNAVRNSINLGEVYGIPNLIVTGSNGGGKSTALRAIVTAVITAQSSGMVAAERAVLPLFSHLETSMRSSDNIGGGESLFQAQAKLADQMIQHARTYQRLSLRALDELFNGTNPIEGPAFAKAVAKMMGKFPQAMTLYATHFPEVTSLAKEESFVNFCVARNEAGAHTYKLQPGFSRSLEATAAAEGMKFDPETLALATRYKSEILASRE